MIRSWHLKGWNLLEFAYKILQLSPNYFAVSLGQNTRDFKRKYELISFVNYFELLSRNQIHFFRWLVLDNFIESIFISKQKICASKKIMIIQKNNNNKKKKNNGKLVIEFLFRKVYIEKNFSQNIFSKVPMNSLISVNLINLIGKKSHSAKLRPEGVLRRP